MLSILSMRFSDFLKILLFGQGAYELIKFPDKLCTGSSIMPQKKNPDAAELVRSKCGRIYSSLLNLLIIQKGLPTGYSKDLQEDKEPVFDAYETINLLLDIVNEMLASIKINKKKMYDWLIKAIPRRGYSRLDS